MSISRKTLVGTALAVLLGAFLFVIAVPQAANAAGCGASYTKVGSPWNHDEGNLLGGVHSWRMQVSTQDCDGYDDINGITIQLTKENGRCSNGLQLDIRDYILNPNILAGWNPGERKINCNGGQTVYNIAWVAPAGLHVRSTMTEANRCIGSHVQVDIAYADDSHGDIPAVCFNGL